MPPARRLYPSGHFGERRRSRVRQNAGNPSRRHQPAFWRMRLQAIGKRRRSRVRQNAGNPSRRHQPVFWRMRLQAFGKCPVGSDIPWVALAAASGSVAAPLARTGVASATHNGLTVPESRARSAPEFLDPPMRQSWHSISKRGRLSISCLTRQTCTWQAGQRGGGSTHAHTRPRRNRALHLRDSLFDHAHRGTSTTPWIATNPHPPRSRPRRRSTFGEPREPTIPCPAKNSSAGTPPRPPSSSATCGTSTGARAPLAASASSGPP